MEEAPENGKESSHSAHTSGMNEWPTNAQLIYTLLYCSYMFRQCCVILREFVVSTLPGYTSMSNAVVGNAI
jgi:hypothetical protein